MARRGKDWNEGLAHDLQGSTFAREFLVGAVEAGIPLQQELGKVIRAMGVKEFADKVGMASPNVLRAINRRHSPTQDTLNRLLSPFKLKLSLAPLRKGEGKRAAGRPNVRSLSLRTSVPIFLRVRLPEQSPQPPSPR